MTVVKSDNFTGTNGSAWNATTWPSTGIDTGATLDIQSNQGRMASGTTAYASVAAALQPGVQNYELSYRFAIPSSGEWYHFVQLRGGTLGSPGPRGLPSAYEVRFTYYAPNSSLGINLYEINATNTKTYRYGGDFLGGTIPAGTFVRAKVYISGAYPSITLKVKVWKDGDVEPGGYTADMSSSVTVSYTGAYMALVLQGGSDTTSDVLLVDDVSIDDFGTGGSFADTEANDSLAGAGVSLSSGGGTAVTEANDALIAVGIAGTTSVSSTVENPTHTYALPGNYLVQFTASNAAGSTTATRIVTVLPTVGPPPPPPPTVVAGTTFLLANLMTGQVIDELEFSSFKYDDVLNRPGGWSATIPLRSSKAIRANFVEGARAVWVVRGGVVLYGGVLWSTSVNVDENGGDVVTLGGQGFWSLYRDGRRTVRSRAGMTRATGVLATDVTWGTNVDLFAIVEDVFAHAANVGGAGDYGFTIDRKGPAVNGYSGALLAGALTFTTEQRRSIASVVEELTARDPGIDFGFRYRFGVPASTPAVIRPVLELNYPLRGAHTAYVLESGKNIASIRYAADGTQIVNYVDGFGAGSGVSMVRATSEDASQRFPAGPFPLLEGAVTDKSAMSVNYLRGELKQSLIASVRPVETIGLTLIETAEIPLGSINAGDFVTLNASDGFLTINGSWRCMAMSASFDADGATTIEGDFAAAALFGSLV